MTQTKRPWLAVAMVAAMMAGCQVSGSASGGSTGGTQPSATATDLTAASTGVCQAIASLPDEAVAQRTFENVAHAALHALAAAPGLERTAAASVLEAMERVETDFSASAPEAALTMDFENLRLKADAALRAIGQAPPSCD